MSDGYVTSSMHGGDIRYKISEHDYVMIQAFVLQAWGQGRNLASTDIPKMLAFGDEFIDALEAQLAKRFLAR